MVYYYKCIINAYSLLTAAVLLPWEEDQCVTLMILSETTTLSLLPGHSQRYVSLLLIVTTSCADITCSSHRQH